MRSSLPTPSQATTVSPVAISTPALAVDVLEERGDFRRNDAAHAALRHLDDRHLRAEAVGDGGNFEADIAAADDRKPRARL